MYVTSFQQMEEGEKEVLIENEVESSKPDEPMES